MAYKFTLTEVIRDYTHIKEEYGYVEVRKVYECSNYDDLQNIFLTLVDFSNGPLKFEVTKEEVTE